VVLIFLDSFYSSLDIVVISMVYLGLSKNDAFDRITGPVVQLVTPKASLRGNALPRQARG
jgi:hypothetical protein